MLAVFLALIVPTAALCPSCNYTETFAGWNFTLTWPVDCPSHSTVMLPGAQSIDNCTCDAGFVKQSDTCESTSVSNALSAAMITGVAAAAAVGAGMASWSVVAPVNMFQGVTIDLQT